MKKVVALVPARSGSKRIENKNIQLIDGMSLIAIAIKQAKEIDLIDEVYVSTDSKLYSEIAKNYGAYIPFIRPAYLSGSDIEDYKVFEHFLNWFEKKYNYQPELIVQIRPTSPIRDLKIINDAIKFMLYNKKFDSLRSVKTSSQTPYKMWLFKNDLLMPFVKNNKSFDMPTQHLQKTYVQDGVVDIIRSSTINNYKNMSGKNIAGIICSNSCDIDEIEDLNYANIIGINKRIMKLSKKQSIQSCLGITQGRLTESKDLQVFPENWSLEFEHARKAGYASIELLRDMEFNAKNPLWQDEKCCKNLLDIALNNGIRLYSICDDYIQSCEWDNINVNNIYKINDLIFKSSILGIRIIVYPLFQKANIDNDIKYQHFIKQIKQIAKYAKTFNICIALELSKNVEFMLKLMNDINETNVGLCIDTGNLYNGDISVINLLKNNKIFRYIFHIHLKDRNIEKQNVPLGYGKVEFQEIIKSIYNMGYYGMLITETSRGNNAFNTAVDNINYLKKIEGAI